MQIEAAQNTLIAGQPIPFDQPCPVCAYNLRSLLIGNRCPECGETINPDKWLRPMQKAFRNPRFSYRLYDAARLMIITLALMVIFAFLPMKFLGDEPVRKGVWAKPYGVYIATIWWVLGWYAVCKVCQTCRWEKGTRWWNTLCWITRVLATSYMLLMFSIARLATGTSISSVLDIAVLASVYLVVFGTPLVIYLQLSHTLVFLGWKKRWTFVSWGVGVFMPVFYALMIFQGVPSMMMIFGRVFSQYTAVLLPTPLHGWPSHWAFLTEVVGEGWPLARWAMLPVAALLLPLITQICLIVTLRRFRASHATSPE